MQKVKFLAGRYEQLVGYIAGIPCILEDAGSGPRPGETWLVEITGTNSRLTAAYVRAVRPWRGAPEDRRAVAHPHVSFRDGTVRLSGRFVFPVEHTMYKELWEDYKLLRDNMNAVIIRDGKAVRWTKKGKPPQVLPLHRFATKYRHQPLLGDPGDVHRFLDQLEELRSDAIESARRRRGKGEREMLEV